jgi:hypothetical protein
MSKNTDVPIDKSLPSNIVAGPSGSHCTSLRNCFLERLGLGLRTSCIRKVLRDAASTVRLQTQDEIDSFLF